MTKIQKEEKELRKELEKELKRIQDKIKNTKVEDWGNIGDLGRILEILKEA